jgi:hypothetical protein
MALKFACHNCGNDIIVQYLKAGEIAKCPQCNTHNVVPNAAEFTDENPNLSLPAGLRPETAADIAPDDFEKINPAGTMRLHGVAIFLIALLWGMLILEIVSFTSDFMEYKLLYGWANGENVSTSEAEANDARQGLIGSFYLIIYGITSITFIVWFFRAHKNLRRAFVPGLKYKSGWTIGSFFVPILCLFRPFQLMKETWKGSTLLYKTRYIKSWDEYATDPLIRWWWGMFILSAYLGNLSLMLLIRPESIDQFLTSDILKMIDDILGIPLALVTIQMIKKITHLQDEAKRKAHLGMMGQAIT